MMPATGRSGHIGQINDSTVDDNLAEAYIMAVVYDFIHENLP